MKSKSIPVIKVGRVRLLVLFAGALLLPAIASATVTTVAYYRLGEADPGAAAGQPANAVTADSGAGTRNLHLFVPANGRTNGTPPIYTANTGVSGSTLSIAFNGGGYTNAPVPMSDNWGLEAWVYTTNVNYTSPDGNEIAFNGNYAASGGMGFFQFGTNWDALVSGIAWVPSPGGGGPLVQTNIWTHLAIVDASGTVTFYVNGVAEATGPAPAPVTAGVGDFSIGDDASPYAGRDASFPGLIDEVRLFTFAPGQFSTNDLLLTSVPPAPEAPAIISGPTVTPPSLILSGTNYVAYGASFSLGVTVGGTGPLSFQWEADGANMSGATNTTLSSSNSTAADSGNYSLVVSSAYGSVTSSVVSVTVLPSSAPSVIPIAYYHLGESDPGAVPGQAANNTTVDSVNGLNLQMSAPAPNYSTNTGVGGSTLCIDVDGGGYEGNAPLVTNDDNWGIEAWVKAPNTNSISSDGYGTIVYNGNTTTGGMGIYQTPDGRYVGFCGTIALVGGAPIVPGAWTHLAMVDTGGRTTFYVNGVATGTGPAPAPSTDAFSIGFNPFIAEPFQGSIDEVRVFAVLPGTFTPGDLLLAGVPPGSQPPQVLSGPTVSPNLPFMPNGYSFSINVLASASGTDPLYYQWRRGGSPLLGATISAISFTNVTTSDSGTYDVVVTNNYGATTSTVATVIVLPVLPAGAKTVAPVAYYRLGENDPGAADSQSATTTVDIVNGVNLVLGGTPPTYSSDTGVKGSTLSVAFDGGGFTNSSAFALTNNWGIEAWVKAAATNNPLSADGYGNIVYNGISGPNGMGIFETPDGRFAGLIGGIAFIGGTNVLQPGVWTHLAIVTTGGTTTFYVNGVATGTTGPTPHSPTAGFGIGFNAEYGGIEPFEGNIDEVRVFTFAPTLFSTNNLLLTSAPPTPSVGILPDGDHVVVLWSGESLEQADSITGPWITITNVTAPWVPPASYGSQFFRAAQP